MSIAKVNKFKREDMDPRLREDEEGGSEFLSSCVPGVAESEAWVILDTDRGSSNLIKNPLFILAKAGIHVFLCFISLSSFSFTENSSLDDSDMHIMVQSTKAKKVQIGLAVVGPQDHVLKQIVDRLQKDLEWSGQCSVVLQDVANLDGVKISEFKKIFSVDLSAAIFISKKNNACTWRLYDLDNVHMIAGHQESCLDIAYAYLAHTIADKVWPYLFGQQSSFRSKIAFCKQVWHVRHGRDKVKKQIWVADFDGSNQTLFIDAPTVSFAPRWNNDVNSPLLFYSENTMSNVQLVLSNMFGKRKLICCFDGLNMQPTFSQDGNKVVFCLSKDGTSQLYLSFVDKVTKKRVFDRLTFNDGRNIAPCFIDNSQVAYVSDVDTNKPQLYILDLQTKQSKRITDGGYCACPNYSSVRQQLVYSKMLGGGMQLFTYDLKTGEHAQLTKTAGSKEEGCWSACGNYIVFGYNQGNVSRIAQLHVPTGVIRFLTPADQSCSYPDCSPIYEQCLGILNR